MLFPKNCAIMQKCAYRGNIAWNQILHNRSRLKIHFDWFIKLTLQKIQSSNFYQLYRMLIQLYASYSSARDLENFQKLSPFSTHFSITTRFWRKCHRRNFFQNTILLHRGLLEMCFCDFTKFSSMKLTKSRSQFNNWYFWRIVRLCRNMNTSNIAWNQIWHNCSHLIIRFHRFKKLRWKESTSWNRLFVSSYDTYPRRIRHYICIKYGCIILHMDNWQHNYRVNFV